MSIIGNDNWQDMFHLDFRSSCEGIFVAFNSTQEDRYDI